MDPIFVGNEATTLATTTVHSDGEEHRVEVWDVQCILELKHLPSDLKPDSPDANRRNTFSIAKIHGYVDAPIGDKTVAPGHHVIGGP